MQVEKLRSLIRESVKDHIKEIEAVAEAAAMDARLAEYDKAIKTCEEKIQTAENLEEVKDLMDTGKLNELKKKLKDLKSKKEKLEKQKAKKNKGKEVTTDAETDKMDEASDKMDETYVEETYTMDEMDMKDEALNESFLKMQKLAGVITEAQYNQKKKALVENQVNESKFVELIKKVFTSPSKDKENKPIETPAEVKSVAQDATAIEKKIADEAKKKAQEEELKKFNEFLYKNQVLQDKLESYLKVVRDIDSEIHYMELNYGYGAGSGFQASDEQKQILDDFFNYVKKIGLDGSIINSLTNSLGNELPKAKAAVLKRYTM